MRTIEYASAFKKDFKRVKASPRHKDVEVLLKGALQLLVADEPLPVSQRDHALTGNWSGYRECHLKPDLLLIYKKPIDETLRIARLGSHSELFS